MGHHRVRDVVVAASTVWTALTVLGAAACVAGGTGTGATGGDGTTPARKVTVAGDSISVGLGASLRAVAPPGTVVKVIGEEGTGLARPDRFDWPERLATLAREFPPSVLVLSLSSNDAQDLVDGQGRTVARFDDRAAWEQAYRERLAAAFDAFPGGATKVVWVGHVRTADPRTGDTNRRVQALATEVAAGRPWVTVADLAALLGVGEEPATRCLMPDGLHITVACLDEAAAGLTRGVLAT